MPSKEFQLNGMKWLSTPIRQLGLKIEGTRLEPILAEFKEELRRAGITRLKPQFYLSTGPSSPSPRTFYIRTTGRPESVAPAVRSEVRSIDPNVAIQDVVTMQRPLSRSVSKRRRIAADPWSLVIRPSSSAGTELQFDEHLQLLEFVDFEPLLPRNDAVLLVQEHKGWKGADAELGSHGAGGDVAAEQQPVVDTQAVA